MYCHASPTFITLAPARLLQYKTTRPTCARRAIPVTCCAPPVGGVVADLRATIAEVAGETRGLFGLEDEVRTRMDVAIRETESRCPIGVPTMNDATAAAGRWRLLYTTLEILGRRRVRLAIGTPSKPGAVTLGEFEQIVSPTTRRACSVVHFTVLGGTKGTFAIDAEYEVVGDARVAVRSIERKLEPEALEKLLGNNVDLLTTIFSPDGWLDITYVDKELRIGRDSNGRVFVLEKVAEEDSS